MISPAFGLAHNQSVESVSDLARAYGNWSGILANHVVTQTGEFTGPDKSSRSISTAEDRELLIALRKMADLIVVDAATARLEGYRVPKSGVNLAILSNSGDFSGIPAVELTPEQTLLFSKESNPSAGRSSELSVLVSEDPIEHLLEIANQQMLYSILWEAGPTLSEIAFDRGLIHKSALTIAPLVEDLKAISKSHPFDRSATLLSVAHSPDATFSYWSH